MIGILGLVVILAICYLLSTNRKAIKPRLLLWGLGLQFGFAIIVLKTPVGGAFQVASRAVNSLLKYSEDGASFLFGDKLDRKSVV